jgi:signal transduction histidine kinase
MEYLSHDLRSPLISTVYMLENQRELLIGIDSSSLDKVERNINRSLGLIDDLLNLARADNLKQEELAPVLFDNVVSNSVDQLSPLAQEKHIVLRIEQDENEDLWVNGNAILLERALINVIGNAIKYSPGETVILVRTLGEARRLCCQVDDEGIGVSEDQILTMFDRFKRSESVERQYQGSGLGLALVSRVVAQHHGHVSAQNLRRGLRVSIELPRLELEDD